METSMAVAPAGAAAAAAAAAEEDEGTEAEAAAATVAAGDSCGSTSARYCTTFSKPTADLCHFPPTSLA
eukprot:1156420-Pelagomonas_calceolata.AAC.3